MKKILLISMALILALGTLGLGYSMWYQTINISGQVSTGNINVGIANIITNDASYGPSPDPLCDPTDYNLSYSDLLTNIESTTAAAAAAGEDKDVAYYDSAPGDGLSSLFNMTTTESDVPYDFYQGIKETVSNAYPGYAPTDWIQIANKGSVPVKLEINVTTDTSSTGDLSPWMWLGWDITGNEGFTEMTGSGDYSAFIGALEGLQLDGGQWIQVKLTTAFMETNVTDYWTWPGYTTHITALNSVVMPQGKTDIFTITVNAVQWNEYPQTPPPAY